MSHNDANAHVFTPQHALDENEKALKETLHTEEAECIVARRARAKTLRDATYAALTSAERLPHSLQGLDTMVERLFTRLDHLEAGLNPPEWEHDPLRAPSHSAAPLIERERIGAEIAAAIEASGLTVAEAYSAVNGAVRDLAKQHPGW